MITTGRAASPVSPIRLAHQGPTPTPAMARARQSSDLQLPSRRSPSLFCRRRAWPQTERPENEILEAPAPAVATRLRRAASRRSTRHRPAATARGRRALVVRLVVSLGRPSSTRNAVMAARRPWAWLQAVPATVHCSSSTPASGPGPAIPFFDREAIRGITLALSVPHAARAETRPTFARLPRPNARLSVAPARAASRSSRDVGRAYLVRARSGHERHSWGGGSSTRPRARPSRPTPAARGAANRLVIATRGGSRRPGVYDGGCSAAQVGDSVRSAASGGDARIIYGVTDGTKRRKQSPRSSTTAKSLLVARSKTDLRMSAATTP